MSLTSIYLPIEIFFILSLIMKKNQSKDFEKVKQKIGKPLPKGLNETKTTFKSKKIGFDRKHVPEAPTETSLQDILKVLNSKDVNIKYDNLRKLEKYVSNHEDTLFMYFPDILKELGCTLQDNDSKIRGESIELVGQCLKCLTDVQCQSFFTHLIIFLKCMMTRGSSMKLDSLKLFDKLLDTHPKIMCHYVDILTNLLNLISKIPDGSVKESKKRVLVEELSSKITTEELRTEVLTRILTFLQTFIANENTNDMDDKEVHWDGKELLFLPLYRNSGTVPAKLDYFWYNQNSNSEMFKPFVLGLVHVLSAILKGVTVFSSNLEPKRKSFMSRSECKFLNIITQILYCIGEWIYEICSKDKSMDLLTDSNFSNEIRVICHQLMINFPYSLHKSCDQSIKMDYMQVNLRICYLYSKFIFETESEKSIDLFRGVLLYIRDASKTSGILCEKSAPLLLKTSKNFIQNKNLEKSAKNGIILSLCNILETYRYCRSPVADILHSFFMDLSLNYDFKNLLDSDAMRVWFDSIYKQLKAVVIFKEVNKKFLKYVQQVCARKYPQFMENLNSWPTNNLIEFLQFDDETFQLTAIHLIASLDVISHQLLEVIAKTITHRDFSLKTALTMIHFLHNRFVKQDISAMDKMNFLKFLLNVGCDSFCDVRSVPKPEELLPLCNRIVEAQQGCLCTYEIYPYPVSKKHLEIFKVCFDYMMSYIRSRIITDYVLSFVNVLCFRDKKLSAHSAIAIMKLRKGFDFLSCNEELSIAVNELYFSSAIYMSFITNAAPEESWDDYLLPQLQDCLCINSLAMMQIIKDKPTGVINYLFKCTGDTTQMKGSVFQFFNALIAHFPEDHTLSSTLMGLCRMWIQ
ncbi:testis-expressed protein 10 [Trichonephila clavipes]|nr:testis-expressed protein 10 [Trichonephila clavipes]